jgi:hypothetical protein
MDPSKMTSNADRQFAAVKGALPPGSEKYIYDGDINAKPINPPQQSVSLVTKFVNNMTAKIRVGEIDKGQAREELQALLNTL